MTESPSPKKPNTAFDIGSAEHVLEGNWEWMKAEGFRPYETLSPKEVERQRHVAQHHQRHVELGEKFGADNVRQGNVYDHEGGRPLQHIPGMTIYVREPPADPSGQSSKAGAGT